MQFTKLVIGCWALGMVFLWWGVAWGEEPKTASAVPEEHATGSVAVLPIIITPPIESSDGFRETFTTLVGAILERAGAKNVKIVETPFSPPETDDVNLVAEALGAWVRRGQVDADHIVLGQVFGTPKKGVKAIRTVVVDRRGKTVLATHDTPETFAQTSALVPKNPMTCAVFLGKKLQKLWGLADPLRAGAPRRTPLQKRLMRESGLPPREEREAIKRRLEAMKKSTEKSRMTLYPIRTLSETNRQAADRLAALVTQESICKTVVAESDPRLEFHGSHNEQKVLWETARAFQAYLKKHPPETEYALFVDYGIARHGKETKVGFVHFIVCDRPGDWVIVDFQNSHHPDFQRIDPKTIDDCNRLVLRRLKRILSE